MREALLQAFTLSGGLSEVAARPQDRIPQNGVARSDVIQAIIRIGDN